MGPDVVLFRKLKDCKLSDNVFVLERSPLVSHMASFYVCFLFVLLNGAKTLNGALERLVSYRFFFRIIVMYRLLTLAMQKFAIFTCAIETDSS